MPSDAFLTHRSSEGQFTYESMPSRVQKLLQWVVALENQHAIQTVCACALDFGENTNMPNGTNDGAGLLLGILAYDT